MQIVIFFSRCFAFQFIGSSCRSVKFCSFMFCSELQLFSFAVFCFAGNIHCLRFSKVRIKSGNLWFYSFIVAFSLPTPNCSNARASTLASFLNFQIFLGFSIFLWRHILIFKSCLDFNYVAHSYRN